MSSNFHANARIAKDALIAAWQDFCLLFPTAESAVEYLHQVVEGDGPIKCQYCANEDLTRNIGERFSYCNRCKRRTWFTSRTLLDHVKHPRAWLATIWFLEAGLHISSTNLAGVLGMAPSSALNMLKKVRLVISDNMEDGAVELPIGHFERLFCKRSKETPAREHPSAELDIIERQSDDPDGHNHTQQEKTEENNHAKVYQNEEDQTDKQLDENQKILLSFLSNEPISADRLLELTCLTAPQMSTAITMLQIAGLCEQLVGDRHIRSDKKPERRSPPISAELAVHMTKAVTTLKNTLHGCSAKAMQLYLADYWRTSCKTVWTNNALLLACIRAGPITDRQILEYVTPPLVQFVHAERQVERTVAC